MSRKAWALLTAEQLKELWSKHKSSEIAEMYGISRNVAKNRLKRLRYLKRGPVNVVWRDTTFEQLKILTANGLSYTQIGNLFGVTKNSVAGKVYRFKQKRGNAAPR